MNNETIRTPEAPYTDLMIFLKDKQFELANMGVSYKNAYDWRNSGLYLQDKQRKYRMKYSPIEYIWLLLVKEIREFGLSFDAIKNVKDFLMMPVDVSALLLTIQDKGFHSEISETAPEDFSVIKGTKEEIEATVEKLGEHIVDSIFTSMLSSTMMKENTYYLRITKDGNCTFESDDDLLLPVLEESHLMIPLTNMIKDFLKKEKIEKYSLEKEDENEFDNKASEYFEFDAIKNMKDFSPRLRDKIDQLLEQVEADQIQYISKDGRKVNIGYDSEEG